MPRTLLVAAAIAALSLNNPTAIAGIADSPRRVLPAQGGATRALHQKVCPADSMLVGTLCVDKYEASIWQIDASKTALINKLKRGTATIADLGGGNAAQAHPANAPGGPPQLDTAGFPVNGNWTKPFYAASLKDVYPTVSVSWLQAAQACALSGKRLLTNQEWQIAAAGTPDPGQNDGTTNHKCNNGTQANHGGTVRRTNQAGQRGDPDENFCVSNWEIEDMVGNVDEFVGDWGQRSEQCSGCGFHFPVPYSADGSDEARIGRTGNLCFGGCFGGAPCTDDTPCKQGSCGTETEGPSRGAGPVSSRRRRRVRRPCRRLFVDRGWFDTHLGRECVLWVSLCEGIGALRILAPPRIRIGGGLPQRTGAELSPQPAPSDQRQI